MVSVPERQYTEIRGGLKFIARPDRDTALGNLRERVAALELEVDHIETVIRRLNDVKRQCRLSRIELEHALALYRAEIGWIGKLADEIESGKLEWKTGHLDPSELMEAQA